MITGGTTESLPTSGLQPALNSVASVPPTRINALLDADLFIYRVGYTTEDTDIGIALWRLDTMISGILDEVGATEYRCFLTSQDKSNFRYDVDSEYKANRTVPKPKHYLPLREHLISKYNAEVIYGMEADDALGIALTDDRSGSVLVSIDKDLNQIPGQHYNFVKKVGYEVTEWEGTRFLYQQILTGDNADGVKGLYGVGPKKADKILSGCETEQDLYDAVLYEYESRSSSPEEAQARVLKAGRLLKIKTRKDEPLWEPPTQKEIMANSDQDWKLNLL